MPYEIVKLPKSNKYMVYNKITKKVYSYHTSRDNAIKQVNMLHLIKGDGIFSTAWDKINDVSKKLIHGRNSLPPRVENILKNYGDAVISGIKIGRTPVPSLITGILKIVSSTPYDKLFHLFIIFTTNKGDILLEKNEVINMLVNPHINAEYLNISNFPNNITINSVITNTEQKMGKDKFIHYSAYDNNCQNFIVNVLKANNIGNESDINFVKQNTESIFQSHPNLRKFSNTLTDIAGRINVLKEGGELKKEINNGLNNKEIERILNKHNYKINGVFSKDELPEELDNGWYVINMQSTNEGDRQGTHWVCFKNIDDGNIIEYFDAFGFYPPIEIMEKAKGNLFYSNKQIQDYDATTCGWFCIGAIVSDTGYGSPLSHFNKYINMFSKTTIVNDKILSDFLTRKHIQ